MGALQLVAVGPSSTFCTKPSLKGTTTSYPLTRVEVLRVQFAAMVADDLPQVSEPVTLVGGATVAVAICVVAAVFVVLKAACAGWAAPRPPRTTATARDISSRLRRMPVIPCPPLRGW